MFNIFTPSALTRLLHHNCGQKFPLLAAFGSGFSTSEYFVLDDEKSLNMFSEIGGKERIEREATETRAGRRWGRAGERKGEESETSHANTDYDHHVGRI